MSLPVPPAAAVYLAVGLGSALGGTLRWQLSLALVGEGWPWATLLANVLGSLAIGLYAALAGSGGRLRAGPLQQQFVLAGLCGGFTTFSIFSGEALALWQAARPGLALGYVFVSLLLWLLAAWAGLTLGRSLNRGQIPEAESHS